MDQVFMNLLVNARDAMPKGGQLTVATSTVTVPSSEPSRHPDAAPGEYVCLTVRDTGTGIDPEHLPHIFEPFFSTRAGGLGLGLPLCETPGQALGGSLRARNVVAPGDGSRGAELALTLPLAGAASVAHAAHRSESIES
jgi:signal transduction histidine kinase